MRNLKSASSAAVLAGVLIALGSPAVASARHADEINCGPGPGGDVFAVVRPDNEPHPETCAVAQNVANAWAAAGSGSTVTVYVDGKDWTCGERPSGPNTFIECAGAATKVRMRS